MNAPQSVAQLASHPLRLERRLAIPDGAIHHEESVARDEIIAGLMRQPAAISPKYFYDKIGCRLFELITELPEYYPTRVERYIVRENSAEIASTIGTQGALIYLGAGNGAKARALFPILKPRQYVAVDFSTGFVRKAMNQLQGEFPHIDMYSVGADFSGDWALPYEIRKESRVFFYPGSSIGNFEPQAAQALLAGICKQCTDTGGLLIGVDLVKEEAALNAAYNDSLGLTAGFNLNILNHANKIVGCNFDLRQWHHDAFFNSHHSRIEMHLRAKEDCVVRWRGGERWFSAGERLHTENSYKYTVDDFKSLLRSAGFGRVHGWLDARGWFGVFYASR